ncbi:hypothetical protein GH714_031914 [Hevea brasiliensis]|uniref:Uncharacterized protein n=1 Tax=Hevea brasiliensis TaxID=3981 RepID=A0A6A6NDW9_HEVBR|nr:hypothetical protein GH714_031914 [Hevea brasiliensis]
MCKRPLLCSAPPVVAVAPSVAAAACHYLMAWYCGRATLFGLESSDLWTTLSNWAMAFGPRVGLWGGWLLGWMHNKIRHTSIQPFKDFTIGNYCVCLSAKSPVDDKVSYIRPRFDSRHEVCDNALSEVEAKKAEGNQEDQTSSAMPELFHGFLAIGTLGSKQVNSEPATPTFPMSLENIADEKIEATENDLKLINNEIEKFIDAEAEEGCNESLARSSYVSNITLSGIQTEGANADDYRNTALCPLQGYLFGHQ